MSSNLDRFADLVKQRRTDLDLTQTDVYTQGGPSQPTQTAIDAGTSKNLTAATLRKLDRGLRWEPGSAKRALAGGDPAPLPDTASHHDADATATMRDVSDAELLAEIARRFSRAETRKVRDPGAISAAAINVPVTTPGAPQSREAMSAEILDIELRAADGFAENRSDDDGAQEARR